MNTPLTYATALEIIKTARGQRKKIDRNTYLELCFEGHPVVRLHNTNVITFKPNGDVTLRTGGWRTVTTKDRINKYSGVSIYQKKGQWFVVDARAGGVDCVFEEGDDYTPAAHAVTA